MTDLRVIDGKNSVDAKPSNPHNIVSNGVTYYFRAKPCGDDGVMLFYDRMMRLEDALPEPFIRMIQSQGHAPNEVMENVVKWHVHLKWWDKVLHRSLEAKARRELSKIKTKLLRHEAVKSTAKNLEMH